MTIVCIIMVTLYQSPSDSLGTRYACNYNYNCNCSVENAWCKLQQLHCYYTTYQWHAANQA